MTMSKLEATLLTQLRACKLLDGMVQEYCFAAEATGGTGPGVRARLKAAGLQNWRIDFAYPLRKLAVEVEGGTWSGGRHTRGSGFEGDTHKYNALTLMGWRLLRFTSTSIQSGVAVQTVEAALKMEWDQPWSITA